MGRIRKDVTWEERLLKYDLRDREHERLGEYANTVSSVRRNKDKLDENTIITFLDLSKELYGRIIYYINYK